MATTNIAYRWCASMLILSALLLAGCASPGGNGEPPWLAIGCLDSSLTSPPALLAPPDYQFNGLENIEDNAVELASTDGSCTGTPVRTATIVRATDPLSAGTLCGSLNQLAAPLPPLVQSGYAAPPDAYVCASDESGEPPWLAIGCLDSSLTSPPALLAPPDYQFNGLENIEDNAVELASTDGSCTGTPVRTATIVRATDPLSAGTLCGSLNQLAVPLPPLVQSGYAAPPDAYVCASDESGEPPWLAIGCLDSSLTSPPALLAPPDYQFNGLENIEDNAVELASTDGSCTGTPVRTATIVRATDPLSAGTLCGSLNQLAVPLPPLVQSGYAAPPDAYVCASL